MSGEQPPQVPDRDGGAGAQSNIGLVEEAQGQSAAALQSHQQALALFRELGHRDSEARATMNIGSPTSKPSRSSVN
jgi:hypothetical protein